MITSLQEGLTVYQNGVSRLLIKMLILFGFFIIFYGFFKFIVVPDGKPIYGVYKQKSKWFFFKYWTYLFVFFVVHVVESACRVFGCRKQPKEVNLMDFEGPAELSNDIKEFDGVYFCGANTHGYYFAIAAERYQKNVAGGFFYLLVPKVGLLYSSKLPDTVLFEGNDEYFGAEGIVISLTEPMKRWKVGFRGAMNLHSDPAKKFQVKFTAQWSSGYGWYDCFNDLHLTSLARSIATEPWSTQFFDKMKSRKFVTSQHFQIGLIKAECTVGEEKYNFASQSLKNRLHGTRGDLLSLHRSVSFSLFLDNGVTAIVVIVARSSGISLLEYGYVQKPDGNLHPMEWCDFQLYQHGECGRPPVDLGFRFKAGSVIYTTQLKVLHEQIHFIGWNWEAKIVERFVKCSVNGVLGRGVSEFHYRNKGGRPSETNDNDPPWFQVLAYRSAFPPLSEIAFPAEMFPDCPSTQPLLHDPLSPSTSLLGSV